MRIRTIKPEFWSHEIMAQLPEFCRLLALALLNYADDEGYFLATPQAIRGALFPFEDDSGRITVGLRELSKVGYLEVRKGVDGRLVGKIVKFGTHQVVNKRIPSKIKHLWGLPEDSGSSPVELPTGTGNREQGIGKEVEELRSSPRIKPQASWSAESGYAIPDSLISEFEKAYPACDIRGQAARAHLWLTSNPKRRKKDCHRFLVNWLARAQERGGDLATEARQGRGPSGYGRNMEPGVLPKQIRYPEPEGWRTFYGEYTEGEMVVPDRWDDVAPATQAFIVQELGKRQEAAQ
jgi:hypothetical protein